MHRKSLLLLPALLLALSLPVQATDQAPGAPPDNAGQAVSADQAPGQAPDQAPGSAGQEFATFQEVSSHTGILVDGDTCAAQDLEGVSDLDSSDFSGTISLLGSLTPQGISGLYLEGDLLTNGIAVTGEETFTIGGTDTPYEVDGHSYNTVIRVSADEGNEVAGYEAVYGVAAAVETGQLRIENSYLYAQGSRSTAVYGFSTQEPEETSLVVVNSHLEAYSPSIWMPPFKLLYGGARASLLMTRGGSWFYDSQLVSNTWGALSQDTVDATTYMLGSTATTTEGGYGAYLTYGLRLYGSALYGGQYGAFLCGTSDLLADNLQAAAQDPDALSQNPDYDTSEDVSSAIVAPYNALVVHNSLPDKTMVAKAVFQDTLLSTLTEHLPSTVTPLPCDSSFFMPGVDPVGSGNGCGAAYFYLRNLYGSVALIRSMNADLTFDGAEVYSSNGVLVQSVLNYDPPEASGYLTPQESQEVPGISVALENGTYTGDLLHQDYQRSMTVTLASDATLIGKAVSGTWAGWNDLWSEEHLTQTLAADGHDPQDFQNDQWVEDVAANLTLEADSAYEDTDNLGISMTLESGALWQVTDTSTLRSLTLEEGATLEAPEGSYLWIYTGCDVSNSLVTYDTQEATLLSSLEPGTYENLVITLQDTPVPEPTPEPQEPVTPAATVTPAPEETPVEETVPAQPATVPYAMLLGATIALLLAALVKKLLKRS